MKLEKAIEILKDATHFHFPADGLDFRDALNLGSEALKLIDQEPPDGYTCIPRPLPGETKD